MKYSNFKSWKGSSRIIKDVLFLTIILLCSYQNLFSQCKLERIKDDFGNGDAVYSNDVPLKHVFPITGSKQPWDLVMSFMLVKGQVSIQVNHKSQSYSSSLSTIYFRFKDGTIVKKETPSTVTDYNTGHGYEYKITGFFLTKEELEIFATKDLMKFQADFRNFPDYPLVEDDIKDKNTDKIRKDASCILIEFNLVLNSNEATKKDATKADDYKCSYEIDKIDPFTKKRNVLTNATVLLDSMLGTVRNMFYVSAGNTNSTNQLKFFYSMNIPQLSKVSQNVSSVTEVKGIMLFDQVDILLENDDAISFKTNEISDFIIQGDVAWSYKLFTIENDSNWQKLKSSSIKTIRLSTNGKELDTREIQKKYLKAITNVINCIDVLGIPKSK